MPRGRAQAQAKRRPAPAAVAREDERDAALAAAARMRVMVPGIGHPLFLPGERVERDLPIRAELFGRPYDLRLIWTSALDAAGGRGAGRLLVSYDPAAHALLGGAFYVTAPGGARCVQSLWVEPDVRASARHARTGAPPGTEAAALVAWMAREAGAACVLEPASRAARAWAARYGFAVVEH